MIPLEKSARPVCRVYFPRRMSWENTDRNGFRCLRTAELCEAGAALRGLRPLGAGEDENFLLDLRREI